MINKVLEASVQTQQNQCHNMNQIAQRLNHYSDLLASILDQQSRLQALMQPLHLSSRQAQLAEGSSSPSTMSVKATSKHRTILTRRGFFLPSLV